MNYKKVIYDTDKMKPLAEDELLLKVRPDGIGFLTKLTQKNKLPVAFEQWDARHLRRDGNDFGFVPHPPIYLVKETFRSGWKVCSWRFGQSQNWAKVQHPDGYQVEIYLSQLLDVMLETTVVEGELVGEYKWEDHELVSNTMVSLQWNAISF